MSNTHSEVMIFDDGNAEDTGKGRKLINVRMSNRTDDTFEIIFDFDDEWHHAAAFHKNDDIEQTARTLRMLEASMRRDAP